MASVTNGNDGLRCVQFVGLDNRRRTVRLGRVPKRHAESFKTSLERLIAAVTVGHAPDGETSRWLAALPDRQYAHLVRGGLVPERVADEERPKMTVRAFLKSWIDSRKGDYKPASLVAWGQVVAALNECFGDRPIEEITVADAESFRQSMLMAGLRPTTIHKRLQHARTFFAHAKKDGLMECNPFASVKHRAGDASERRAYVPAEDALAVIEHAPNAAWKLLIALSRFAGLRVPSEALSLRWSDVDWERSRITVFSPKTEHLPGKAYRTIPLFPELRSYLEAARTDAEEGDEFVLPESIRKGTSTKAGWVNSKLHTRLNRIIERAGLEPWSRLWHSMRASCQTDLAGRFPLPVVCKWLGNTQPIALRHYIDVTDADFERAVSHQAEAVQNQVQQVHEMNGMVSQPVTTPTAKALRIAKSGCRKEHPQRDRMEVLGPLARCGLMRIT
jgi:integrase